MSKEFLLQFVGFKSNALGRDYTFLLQEPAVAPREFIVSIATEAFSKHRLRFQDAPDICCLKLRRELINGPYVLTESHFHLTDAELDDYRTSHEPAPRVPIAYKPAHKS